MKARGLGRVYQRGSVWWVQYNHRGKKYRESSGSTRRSDAVKLLRKRQSELASGKPRVDVEKTTFEDLAKILLDNYAANGLKTERQARIAIDHLRSVFGPYQAIDITTDRLTAYIRARQEEDAANATIQRELAVFKRAFKLAEQSGRVYKQPVFPTIKVRNTREGFFEAEDFLALLKHLPAHLVPVVEFAYYTGWRLGEILSLQWKHVDRIAGIVRLEPGTTKNEDGRAFPYKVLPELVRILNTQRRRTTRLESEKSEIIPSVFHKKGERIRDIRKSWANATKAAGLVGRRFHDLRRTAVRNLERSGVPRSVAMKLVGHKTEAVYRRYAIAAEKDLAEGVERLASFFSAQKRHKSGTIRSEPPA